MWQSRGQPQGTTLRVKCVKQLGSFMLKTYTTLLATAKGSVQVAGQNQLAIIRNARTRDTVNFPKKSRTESLSIGLLQANPSKSGI